MPLNMADNALTTNERLRELVEAARLPPAVALTIFNRGLGPSACSESTWRAFLEDPRSPRYRSLEEALLTHAEEQFAKVLR